MPAKKYASVDEYLDDFSGDTRARLDELRALARKVFPDAEEGISYNIPAYRHDNVWVAYISGYAKHVSLSLGGRIGKVAEVFEKELAPYKTSVSAIQFQNKEPLPIALIRTILEYRRDNGLK